MIPHWQFWIDTGGTFTDCLARDPGGVLHRAKVLSSSALRGRVLAGPGAGRASRADRTVPIAAPWADCDDLIRGFTFRLLDQREDERRIVSYDARRGVIELDHPIPADAGAAFEVASVEPAPILAARLVTKTMAGSPLPESVMRLATTRGTNALLERRGARTALFTTAGFGDLLEIGDQQRPDLFALEVRKCPPLPERVVEVPERIAADGSIVTPLDPHVVETAARSLLAAGIDCAAVALLNSYRNDEHERRVAALLVRLGFAHVSVSAALAPLIKLLPRAETAVVDAYLAPVISEYLDDVARGLGGDGGEDGGGCRNRLHVMTSAGGLVGAREYSARDSLLSGPAGGVSGAAAAGRRAGFERIIGFDMGGTSTDVARYDGDFEYRFEQRTAGVRLVAPALAIETVAAGGGSICRWEGGRLRVGPESASADPGPACYGAGGPLTLTDVNLLLGRLDPAGFEIPVSRERAEAALDSVRDAIAGSESNPPGREEVLDGFLAIADERMASAIAQVSIRRGFDPAEYALVAFGGAGGQHACGLARRLGIDAIVLPVDGSLLSADGLRHASVERFAEEQVLRRLDDVAPEIERRLDALAGRARSAVAAEGEAPESIIVRRRLAGLRLLGQETALDLDVLDPSGLAASFARRYEATYGHAPPDKPIEVVTLRVVANAPSPEAATPVLAGMAAVGAAPTRSGRVWFDGDWVETGGYERRALADGARIEGPALIFDARTSYVIEAGWTAECRGAAELIVRRGGASVGAGGEARTVVRSESVRQELFTNRFVAIAGEMGQMLERTAVSTNVKERQDFSCALLDRRGELVVNAPHIPVHLGAMGVCVRAVVTRLDMRPGDVCVTNHPAFGGSHLPDVTVITPVFDEDHEDAEALLGFVANRAHHAEIGGTRPGSMPPGARTLAEEGVVIEPMRLVDAGISRYDEIERLLRRGPHPTRAVEDNLADLRAQVAANHHGAEALRKLARSSGAAEIEARMRGLTDRAERLTRAALAALPPGVRDAEERLDDGTPIRVSIRIEDGGAIIDFAGTGGTHAGNLNATPAIVRSAVLYVLRVLMGAAGEDIPLNEGIMRAVDLRISPGLLDPEFTDDPATSPAVVGGNVETSQRVVDTLLKALHLCAASQGTMNNVLFGSDEFGYYETVGGGGGAGPEFDGADAIHSHMTNTRITDAEVLEHRYPVRIERFAVRRGSGGAGLWRGGDGIIREYLFERALDLSVLTQRRREGPYGGDGGAAGRPGRQTVIRAGGGETRLAACDACAVGPGDRLVLWTPGGGGWGRSAAE